MEMTSTYSNVVWDKCSGSAIGAACFISVYCIPVYASVARVGMSYMRCMCY